MSKTSNLLAAAAFITVTATFMLPGDARAGGAEMLRECLESIERAPNEEQARSMCYWKHYEYMASYGQ